MKATVILCDICKRRVATRQCVLCHADICPACIRPVNIHQIDSHLSIDFGDDKGVLICAKCKRNILRGLEQIKDREMIIKHLLDAIVKLIGVSSL